MAGRISPLLGWGKEYSRKVPLAIIDGVVLDREWSVGESIGPMCDVVDVNVSLQAVMSSKRRSKIGRNLIRFMSQPLLQAPHHQPVVSVVR